MKKLIGTIIAFLIVLAMGSFVLHYFDLTDTSKWNVKGIQESEGAKQISKIRSLKKAFRATEDSVLKEELYLEIQAVKKEMLSDFIDDTPLFWSVKNKFTKKDSIQ